MILAAKNYFSESGTEVRNHIAIMKTTEVLTAPFQVPGRICRIEDISRTALKELEFLKNIRFDPAQVRLVLTATTKPDLDMTFAQEEIANSS